ncbi:DUF2628 domain-containing protein [Prosthecomicrobium sp. N25]|uniref:DUF2628 domain-containing protein n=1 Tax=Prosthecomicrobium sp. N25 TaxID=3129254 RepID=UPI003077955B
MPIYTVHAPAGATGPEVHDRTVLVREGFSWAALIFQVFWILWHRLWWVLAGWLAAFAAIAAVSRFSPASGSVLEMLFFVWFATVANDARRWTLERRGLGLAGVVHAPNTDEAEKRWFDRLAGAALDMTRRMASPPPAAPAARPPRLVPPGGALPPVVGFPEART